MTTNTLYFSQEKHVGLSIPSGSWRAVFRGTNAGTLNGLSFAPGLDSTAAAAALDLAPGLAVTLPAPGATAAPVSRDGMDALQIVAEGRGARTQPLVSLSFTGPGLLTGWLRTGQKIPPQFNPWVRPWVSGRDLDHSIR